jgi:hypothetical protein
VIHFVTFLRITLRLKQNAHLRASVLYTVLRAHWFAYDRQPHSPSVYIYPWLFFSTVNLLFCLEGRASRFLRNVGNDLRDYTASQHSVLLTFMAAVNVMWPEARCNKTDKQAVAIRAVYFVSSPLWNCLHTHKILD